MIQRLLLTGLLVIFASGVAHAVPGESGFWLTGMGYYAFAKDESSNDMLHGAGVAGTLEGMRGTNVSLGLSLAYSSIDVQSSVDGVPTRRRVSSMPAYLMLRYWIGDPSSKARAYISGAAGVYLSFLDTTDLETGKQTSLGESGFALAVPVGFTYSLGPRISLNANYSLNWLADHSYVNNGLTHAVGLGLAFSLSQ